MRGAAIAAFLLLAAGCGPGALVRHGAVNDDALGAVRRGLPAIRGLDFVAPVPALAMGPDDVAAAFARELDESYPPGDLERLAAVYARLGLLPANTPLRPALQRLYEGQVAAFYDPRPKHLVLATRALSNVGIGIRLLSLLTGHDVVGEMLVAHELVHALQDQHYGIPLDPEPLTDAHSDRLLARRALLEGDATLAGFAYIRHGELDSGTVAWIERQLHVIPGELARQYPDIPEVVRTTLGFQYDAGTTFTGRAFAAGGWAAVDRVHRDPPDSTEQVLHPARYFGLRDRPVEIQLDGTEELEARGWTRIFEDTLGELDIQTLARRALPAEPAAQVADGWGGDRLRALERSADLVLVWMTAWDDPPDAEEFVNAMPSIAPDARIERRAEHVLVLLGPADGTVDLDTLATQVWARSGFEGPGLECGRATGAS